MFLRMQTWTRTGMMRDRINSRGSSSSRLSMQQGKSAKAHAVETEELVNLRQAISRNEKEKKQKHGRNEFLTSLLHLSTSAELAKLMIEQPPPKRKLSTEEIKLVRVSTANELAALNAAVAAIVLLKYDLSDGRNYRKAILSTAIMERVIPDLVQDFRNLVNGHSQREIEDIMSNLGILCSAVEELSQCAAKEDTRALNDAVFHYLCPAIRLFVSVLSIDEATRALIKAHRLIEKTQDVCKHALEFAEFIYVNSPGTSSRQDFHDKFRSVDLAAQAMTLTVQLTAPTLFASSSQTAIFKAVAALLVAIENFDEKHYSMRTLRRLELKGRKRDFDVTTNELLMMVRSGEEQDTTGVESQAKSKDDSSLSVTLKRLAI